MDVELLQERAGIVREVRAFFDKQDYLEVDTPLLAPDLIPETCLEVFETAWIPPRGSRQRAEKRWLVPSPEIWMKKLIARYRASIYQICKCFRNTESRGYLHSPEFTMLEYYTIGADYLDSLALTEHLFDHLLNSALLNSADTEKSAALRPPFLRITMEEAFRRWAGFSLAETAAAGPEAMKAEARRLGLFPEGTGPAIPDKASLKDNEAILSALFDLVFIHAVEPSLPREKPLFILDYPAFVPCLARSGGSAGLPSTRERWELYINGIELANCYSEETDPDAIRRYFEAEGAEKARSALVQHNIDGDYWKTFLPGQDGSGFPPCSGTAMGIDRLVMVLAGASSIDKVLPFPESEER